MAVLWQASSSHTGRRWSWTPSPSASITQGIRRNTGAQLKEPGERRLLFWKRTILMASLNQSAADCWITFSTAERKASPDQPDQETAACLLQLFFSLCYINNISWHMEYTFMLSNLCINYENHQHTEGLNANATVESLHGNPARSDRKQSSKDKQWKQQEADQTTTKTIIYRLVFDWAAAMCEVS